MLKNQKSRLIASMLLSMGLPVLAHAAAPYVDSYHVNRQLYVSPTGSGNGLTALTPMSLNQATSTAQPGDLYWLGGGTYNTGAKTYTRNGTKANPIIYRSMAGQRATIVGQVIDQGAYNWFWGLEITDPNGTTKDAVPGSPSGSLAAYAPGAHFINNYIHDVWQNAIGGWNTGPNHVYYGNITHNIGLSDDPTHHGYPIYTQNDYALNGSKYIVQNMFLDNVDPYGNDLDFHGYTEGNEISGLDLRKNIMSNSRFLLGGYSVADHSNVSANRFYNLQVQFGWRRPVTGAFTDNYLGKSPLLATYYWGINLPNPKYPKEGPFNITGNTFVNTPATAIDLTTVSYDATTLYTGVSKLDSADKIDNNVYQGTFTGRLFANNQNKTNLTFAQWKAAALAAGNAFDANSQQIAAPTGPMVIVDVNEYDPTLASMAIYNWAHTPSVLADLSSIMPAGSPFGIYDAKDAYGSPLVSGNYFAPVSVPMNTNPLSGNEFGAYLIRFTAAPEPSSLALLVFLPLAVRRKRETR